MRRGGFDRTGQLHSGNHALSAPSGWQKAFDLVNGKSGFDLSAGSQAYCFGIFAQRTVELDKLRRSHGVSGAEGCS